MKIVWAILNFFAALRYALGAKDFGAGRWTNFRCRFRGHRCGMIYYNPGGLQPDYRCRNCDEDIG